MHTLKNRTIKNVFKGIVHFEIFFGMF